MGRVSTRLGMKGCNRDFFNILLEQDNLVPISFDMLSPVSGIEDNRRVADNHIIVKR